MHTDDIRRALEIFETVADLPREELGAKLTELCDGRDDIRARVEQMLSEDNSDSEEASSLGVRSGEALVADMFLQQTRAPARIASYSVIEELGSGGAGVVYAAAQREPARRVAVKILRAHFDRGESASRFRREARLLGKLSHPNIATVYEAGIGQVEFEDGSTTRAPFIAMELIDGEPLDAYISNREPALHTRLELFVKVCDAVAHAHAEGITHRDLKPDNVLVSTDGEPKVLDFGVARTVQSDVGAETLRTETGQIIGTTSYMSPEQATGDPDLIGPRSDVYALGVMLHETLAGKPPLDVRDLQIIEALRVISEKQPTLLGAVDARFRGDLETIVSKALEKDPQRR